MRRLTAAIALAVFLGVAVLSIQTTSVHACTPATSEVPRIWGDHIVGGRVLSYEAPPLFDDHNESSFLVIEHIELEIAEVFSGDVEPSVVRASREAWVGEVQSGSCGVLAQDMQDDYVIIGLFDREGGIYAMPQVIPLFAGSEPSGEEYEAALQYLRVLRDPVLPLTGAGPGPSTRTYHLIAGLAAVGVALLAASITVSRRTNSI